MNPSENHALDNPHSSLAGASIARHEQDLDPSSPTACRQTADVEVDRAARRAFVSGCELPLTTRLFDLLAFFLERRGAALSFDEIGRAVWNNRRDSGDHRFLHTAVYRLRGILNSAGAENFVEGIRGFGYRVRATSPSPDVSIEASAPPERAMVVLDPSGLRLRLSMANEAATELTGYAIDVLTRRTDAAISLWLPPDRAFIHSAVSETLASGRAETRGRELRRANDEIINVDVVLGRLDLPSRPPLCVAELQESNA